jgi:hypothetical protein
LTQYCIWVECVEDHTKIKWISNQKLKESATDLGMITCRIDCEWSRNWETGEGFMIYTDSRPVSFSKVFSQGIMIAGHSGACL